MVVNTPVGARRKTQETPQRGRQEELPEDTEAASVHVKVKVPLHIKFKSFFCKRTLSKGIKPVLANGRTFLLITCCHHNITSGQRPAKTRGTENSLVSTLTWKPLTPGAPFGPWRPSGPWKEKEKLQQGEKSRTGKVTCAVKWLSPNRARARGLCSARFAQWRC